MAATRKFFGKKKILFLAKVIEFSNRENTNIYIACGQTLIAINRKLTLKSILLKLSPICKLLNYIACK